MERRNFTTRGGKRYRLVARGEADALEHALDLVQHWISTSDMPTIKGIIEVENVLVTIELLY